MKSADFGTSAAEPTENGAPPAATISSLAEAESALRRGEFGRVAEFAGAALARNPDDLGALLLAGDAAAETERFAEAASAFRRALETDGDNVRALNGLAAAALGARDPELALGYAKRAWRLAPMAVDSYLALAPSAICLQDEPAIEACFAFAAKATEAVASHLQSFWAQSLAYLDKFDYAAGLYEPLARARPRDFQRLFTLAYYLLRAQKISQAKDAIDALAALAPDAPEPHDLLAEWATQTGDLTLAKLAARRALACDPNRAAAYLTLAKTDPADIRETEIARLTSLLNAHNHSVPSRFAAGLALGLALEFRRDHDGAFAAFSTANSLARDAARSAGVGYDRARTEAQLALTRRLFPRESLAKPIVGTDRGGDLILVLGMPRSGTTLVDQILASHSRVMSVGENPAMTRLFDTFVERARSTNEDVESILARHGEEWRRLYRRSVANDAPQNLIVDKALMNFWAIGLVARLFPDARIILMRRDPMDVCLSIFRLNFLQFYAFSNDLEETAHYYRCFEDMCAHWLAALPAKIKVVEYETLLEDFENRVADLLAYCGLETEAACLAFHQNRRPVFTLSAAQVRKGVDKTARGRWRRYERHLGALKAALAVSPHGD